MHLYRRQPVIVALVLFAGFCIWMSSPKSGNQSQADATLQTNSAALTSVESTRRLTTTPIQDLRVGMRVVGRNPLAEDAARDLPQPEAATWRLVRARIEMAPRKFCEVDLLRPIEWIEENGASADASIWLELPEMFVAGEAQVLAIETCPPLESGLNPIITGTFRHIADQVIELQVDQSEAAPIRCTPQHPFWSNNRKEFVPALSLQVGEDVLTAYGNSARISSIVPRAGPETVFGLEIYGEHVYHVGSLGLLAHNASTPSGPAAKVEVNHKDAALDLLRPLRGGLKNDAIRNMPGVTRGGESLPDITTGQWLQNGAGPIPGQIARQLREIGEFNSFREFRETFWRLVAEDPHLGPQFRNRSAMLKGHAPTAPTQFQVGRGAANRNFNLDHIDALEEQFSLQQAHELLYNLDNLQVAAPFWNQAR